MSSFLEHAVTLRWPRKARPSKGTPGPSFGARRKRGERLRMTLWVWLGLAASTSWAAAEPGRFGYGKPATPAEIAGWDIDVRGDDGAGLPDGQGSVAKGGPVYAEQCAVCHGTFGEGAGRFPKLVGGVGTLTHDRPELTVGSYWPFAPTLWDYINRAMPMQVPHTLSADDVYALTAYILHLNDVVAGDFVADRNSLPKVSMPNRDSFVWTDPRPDTTAVPCMTACADPDRVTITSTAEGKNLTPRTTGPLDSMQPK
jgi:mono/diheme cytochrome c family protein